MPSSVDIVTSLSSTVIRALTFIFLRWIPGHHLPPIIYTSFFVYVISFIRSFGETSPYKVLVDEFEVVVKETVSQGDDTEDELEEEEEEEEEVLVNGVPPPAEIEIDEVTILEEKNAQPWTTILWGIPSPTSTFLSVVTFVVNILAITMVTDLVYTAPVLYEAHDLSFARVGFVSDHSASILFREARGSKYPIFLSYRWADDPSTATGRVDDAWKHVGSIHWATNATDYTSTITIPDLKSDTRYEYSVNSHIGHFVTAPKVGQVSSRTDGKFTFLTTSCIKPRFPYAPFQHPLHFPGFKHLAALIPELKAHFMLFLGDFIYVDVPHRFGVDIETYRREYRQVYASPDWPSVTEGLPWLHVIDDHEIANDWDGNTTGVYQAAADPWTHYHAAANPPVARAGETYFSFTQGPASFFLMDTRRYRSPEKGSPTDPTKSMLGKQQLADFLSWLAAPVPHGVRWKIVISSIPFTKNWRVNNDDTWAGYLYERKNILEAMWEVGATSGVGVVVLSGDRHEFAATSFPPPEGGRWPISAAVHEFSTSPLSMFYLPVRTYSQSDEEDVMIKYEPDGNSKFSAVEISSSEHSDQSKLNFRLFVDGEETWAYEILAPPAGDVKGKRNRDAIWS